MVKHAATSAKAFERDGNVEIYLTMGSGNKDWFRLRPLAQGAGSPTCWMRNTRLHLMLGPDKASRDFAGELKAARTIARGVRPETSQ